MSPKNISTQDDYQKERFKLIFEYSPVAIWEEDYSPVYKLKKQLRDKKVSDVHAYLNEHSQVVLGAFRKIKVLNINKAALRLYGAKSKKELLENLDKTIHKDAIRVITEEFAALITGKQIFEADFKSKTLDGKLNDVKLCVAVPDIYKETFERVIVTLQDITKEKEYERHLQKLAHTDGLTGVLNHNAVLERLHTELLRAERYALPVSCLMIDLDYFKGINDLCGHQKGDQVLQKVAHTLVQSLREVDIVGRYGGDEFLVILPQTAKENALIAAGRLKDIFEKLTTEAAEGTMYSTISIGIAGLPDRSIKTSKDFIAKADKAMYKAKKDGRNTIAVE